MSNCLFIGFDFSMNKPAATILYKKEFYFFIWPIDITKNNIKKFQECNINVYNRALNAISAENLPNSQIVIEHTKRSTNLANLIIDTIDLFIANIVKTEKIDMFISSEGLSYGSKGDAALNLATYKGVLLSKLYEHYIDQLKGLYTYPPITIKSVAGCAKKGELSNKNKMINAFTKEPCKTLFKEFLLNGKLLAKTNYIPCVDDIVDSYWALKTMLVKEKFIK